MLLVDLKKSLATKQKLPYYIFTGEEVAVSDAYIKNMSKIFNLPVIRVDSLSDIYSKLKNKSMLNKNYCYLISNDTDFLKAEKIWEELKETNKACDNIVIFTYATIDKRSKFFKHFNKDEQPLVEFEKLGNDVLTKYIDAKAQLLPAQKQNLIDFTGGNYNRILLELDKVTTLAKVRQVTESVAFNYALENRLFFIPDGDIVFEFVDDICSLKYYEAYDKWAKLKSYESPIKILSLLYTNFRSMLSLKMAGEMSGICEFTGLTPWQIKLVKNKLPLFKQAKLLTIVKSLQHIESGIKKGRVEQDVAIDYALSIIFSRGSNGY